MSETRQDLLPLLQEARRVQLHRSVTRSEAAREVLTCEALELREKLHAKWLAEERADADADAVAAMGRVEAARPWHCELPEGFDFSPEPWQAEDE